MALVLPSVTHAGTNSYICEIKEGRSLSKDGFLASESAVANKMILGSKFSVSRITGQILGDAVSTETASSTKVLQQGSMEDSFRAIADWANPNLATHAFQLLEIQEFVKAPDKPFIVFASGGIGLRSGVCR